MIQYQAAHVLLRLEVEIEARPTDRPEPMNGDKWLLASAMQKAIRQGNVNDATRAAYGLWCQDRQSFWRRLHVISIEDVGIASPKEVAETLLATSSSIWRRRIGDLNVGLHLTRKLCEAVKTRVADEVLIQAERASCHTELRHRLSLMNDDQLVKAVTNPAVTLIERCLSIWYLAGMRKFPTDLMPGRNGQPEDAAELLRLLSIPTDLVEGCLSVMGRTQWPLSIFTPIIYQEAQRHEAATVHEEAFDPVPTVSGLPVYACDMFTRIGQASFRRLQREVPDLKSFTPRQIGIGTFYREGGMMNKTLTSPFYDEHRHAGELADADGAGMTIPDYLMLCECLRASHNRLDEIRVELLERYFDRAVTWAA